MLQSYVIDVDGTFVGAAVLLDTGYRFIATDIRLDDLDGTVWPTLADVKRLARGLYRTGRFGCAIEENEPVANRPRLAAAVTGS
jgi:hypothetical protein